MPKETRAAFIPPPLPTQPTPEQLLLWVRRLTSTLPTYFNNLQQIIHETQQQLYDIQVAVGLVEPVEEAEAVAAHKTSAGVLG